MSGFRYDGCVGPFDDARLQEFSFDLPAGYRYLRLEVEDEQGRRAWTNTLFMD